MAPLPHRFDVHSHVDALFACPRMRQRYKIDVNEE
jgi:hypothetical protein